MTGPPATTDAPDPLEVRVLALCTGNVARSVMLGYMLCTLAAAGARPWRVRTAGTHVAEGSAMSMRTMRALENLGHLGEQRYGAHRSHQVDASDVAWADVIVATEADQVRFVRRHFPDGADRTVALGEITDVALTGGTWREVVAAAASREPRGTLDVLDPAGGDQDAYDACARELWSKAQVIAATLARDGP